MDSERANGPNYRAQVEGPFYLGPRTFMKVPALHEEEDLDRVRPDVAILGAPWDDSVANRPGGRFGPQSVRTANYIMPMWHQELEVSPLESLSVVDYGDAACSPGLVNESHASIFDRVSEIASRNIVPVVIGGDHSITLPAATAVASAVAPRRLGILHFDAHPDTADSVFGNLKSHGTPMRRLIESGAVPGERFVQIGIRGYWPPPEDLEWMRRQGMRWHLMQKVREKGIVAVVSEALDQLRETSDVLYVSIDIDVLDPAYAPGTGTPEPGGMIPSDLLFAVRMAGLAFDIAGMDVVEVIPAYDPGELTAQNANRCILEMLSTLARKAQDSGENRASQDD